MKKKDDELYKKRQDEWKKDVLTLIGYATCPPDADWLWLQTV